MNDGYECTEMEVGVWKRAYVNGGLSIFELVSSHGTRIWTLCPSAQSFFAREYPSTACPPLGVFTMSTFFEPDAVDARTRTLVRLDVTCLHRRRLDDDRAHDDADDADAPAMQSLSCSLVLSLSVCKCVA